MTALIWEIESSHYTQEDHDVIRTDCTVTIRVHSPRCDTCPKPTKRRLFEGTCWEVEATCPYRPLMTSRQHLA